VVSLLERRVPRGTIDGWLRGWKKEINSIVPGGTEVSFCFISQHFVLGYFPWVPTGRTRRKCDGLMLKRIGGYGTESGRDPSPI
jgi:hypothetical protein